MGREERLSKRYILQGGLKDTGEHYTEVVFKSRYYIYIKSIFILISMIGV